MTELTPSATHIDQMVGERIRRRRVLLGLTQDQLADGLGISYQQVQKYETGANRVSAGRLYQIAVSLDTRISYFFEGADGSAGAFSDNDIASSRNVIELVRSFSKITDDKVRATVMTLVRTLAGDDDEQETPLRALGNGIGYKADAGRTNGNAIR
ncbi:MAG: helix-turn-helix transcriptional regulator [Pseudomonadota bacterium]